MQSSASQSSSTQLPVTPEDVYLGFRHSAPTLYSVQDAGNWLSSITSHALVASIQSTMRSVRAFGLADNRYFSIRFSDAETARVFKMVCSEAIQTRQMGHVIVASDPSHVQNVRY